MKTLLLILLIAMLFNMGPVRVTEVPICYTERRLGESKMSKGVIAEALVRPWVLACRERRAWRQAGQREEGDRHE